MTAPVTSALVRLGTLLGGSALRVGIALVTATSVTAAVAGPMAYQAHEARDRLDEIAEAAARTQEEGVGGGTIPRQATTTTVPTTTSESTTTSEPTTTSESTTTVAPTTTGSTVPTSTTPGTTAPVTLPTVPPLELPGEPSTTVPPAQPASGITFSRTVGGPSQPLEGRTLSHEVFIGLDAGIFPSILSVLFTLDGQPAASILNWPLNTCDLVNGSNHRISVVVTTLAGIFQPGSASFTVNNGQTSNC